MRRLVPTLLLAASALATVALFNTTAHAADGPTIRRLDGSKLPIAQADSLARRVLHEHNS